MPKLLLHACCAPCSTAVYEKLCTDFDLTVYWYNPNIFPLKEHNKRLNEVKILAKLLKFKLIINLASANDYQLWQNHSDQQFNNSAIKQLTNSPEGGPRCWLCYQFRLKKVVKYALDNNFDYFTTTLTVSPHKNTARILEIGKALENNFPRPESSLVGWIDENSIKFLAGDFKKAGGYRRSIELSKKYDLYRQDYCGCEYSLDPGKDN